MPESSAPLSARPARPYRVRLDADTTPEQLVATLTAGDHPGVLWGDWFGGGVTVFRAPLRRLAIERAEDAYGVLAALPSVDAPFDGIGGGWLTCLGYTPGHSALAFYDSLLRWQPEVGWTFESLGLDGRAEADANALLTWRRRLADPTPRPAPTVGTFATQEAPDAARDRHLGAVEAAIGRIHQGAFYQLNLCTRLHATYEGEPAALFAGMAAKLQPAYGALVTLDPLAVTPRALASLSPELFLRVRGRTVTTSPIKGTAPRIGDETDSAVLRASAKDAAENVMIVDLMRNDLSRVCRPGSVRVSDLLAVEPHPGVWHLVSTVHGELADDAGLPDLLAAAFPPGSVTGAPKHTARLGIAALEPESRGAYTGAIGLVSPCAGTDLNVVIRTLELTATHAELGVGGGITADSVPIREWYECLHKARPLVRAAGSTLGAGLDIEPAVPAPELRAGGVFESVLVVAGQPLRLEAHLARLDASCRELYGVGLPELLAPAVRRQVAQAVPVPRAVLRVTARPGADGGLDTHVELRPLGGRLGSCTLVRQPRPLRTWRHKWVDRVGLEAAELAAAPALPYFTDRADSHRLAETSRGNLFLLGQDGVWATPPLDESVLPGVTRREVLDLFAEHDVDVRIARCDVQDLYAARAAFWTSSLNGAVAVSAVDGRALTRADAVLDLLAVLHQPARPRGNRLGADRYGMTARR